VSCSFENKRVNLTCLPNFSDKKLVTFFSVQFVPNMIFSIKTPLQRLGCSPSIFFSFENSNFQNLNAKEIGLHQRSPNINFPTQKTKLWIHLTVLIYLLYLLKENDSDFFYFLLTSKRSSTKVA
jgi:hypothetical protein